MKTVIVSLLLAASANAQTVLGPYSTATNFSIDLAGTPDLRQTSWGNAGYAQNQIVFTPPVGYRVRIMRVTGDFVYWAKNGTPSSGTSSEVGWGLKTTAPDGDSNVSNAYANTLEWVQAVLLPNGGSRIAYDLDTHPNGLLNADNILISQTFVALNTTGLVIHMEPTFVIVYRFEKGN
jgi:hypothetical protein